MPERTFKCGCGDLEVKLPMKTLVECSCHCHSCVSAARFIDEKHGNSERGFTSSIDENGGNTLSILYLSSTSFPANFNAEEKLGYVKVGDKGTVVRYYTKCCGTMIFSMMRGATNAGFNLNAIYNEDGTRYVPKEKLVNIMAKHAFDPEKVPDPKSDTAPLGMMFKFIPVMVKSSLGIGKSKIDIDTNPDLSKAEVVPITWE